VRVFITGGSSGIGSALATHYVKAGAQVGVCGRRERALRALAAELGPQLSVYLADVRDADAMRGVAQAFTDDHGLPDIVIANAGVSHGTLIGESADVAAFQDIVDTNLTGMVKTFQPFIQQMVGARRGTLVGIASVAGVRGLPGAGAYSASKAAAINYLESLRVELRSTGVRVVTLMPGYIDTPMTLGNPYPMPFLLSPEEAARRFARAIAAQKPVAIVPWQMAIVARLLGWMPAWLYDALLARVPRKPRRSLE